MEQNPVQQPSKSLTSQVMPWKGEVLWWIIVTEGAIALLLGIYVITRPEQAAGIMVRVIGGYLLFTSLLSIYRLIAHKDDPAGSPARWIRVGIGLVAGLVALFYPRMSTIDAPAAATILAIGLLLDGILGIYAIIVTRAIAGWRWGQMIIYALYVVLALLTFSHNRTGADSWVIPMLGWLLVIAGIALIGYGIWIYQKLSAAKAAALAATVQTPGAEPLDAAAPSPATPAALSTSPTIQSTPATSSSVAADGNDDGKAVKP